MVISFVAGEMSFERIMQDWEFYVHFSLTFRLLQSVKASKTDIGCIQNSLGLKNCHNIIANPDRKNIFYKKFFPTGQDSDAVQSILMP